VTFLGKSIRVVMIVPEVEGSMFFDTMLGDCLKKELGPIVGALPLSIFVFPH